MLSRWTCDHICSHGLGARRGESSHYAQSLYPVNEAPLITTFSFSYATLSETPLLRVGGIKAKTLSATTMREKEPAQAAAATTMKTPRRAVQ